MKVSLPYAKQQRYLTGMDWVIGALDHMSHRRTGGGNASQIVLELRGPFAFEQFCTAVSAFVRLFPMLGGRPARHWNLAPYWKIPRTGPAEVCSVTEQAVTEAELWPALEASVNTPFTGRQGHVAWRVLQVNPERHFVAFHFEHLLFDAYGAEAFLELFQNWQQGVDCRARLAQLALTEPAHLCAWMRKFEAGKQFVRKVRELATTTPRILPRPAVLQGRRFRFSLLEFNAQETAQITARAYQEAGFLMFMPYVLATVLPALEKTFAAKAATGQDYVISVSVDLRTPDTAAARLFFNNLSFLLFKIPQTCAGDRRQVLELVRTQMYEQVKSGFPKALAESSMLMRILPLPVLSWALLRPLLGEFASLGFTCVGKGGFASAQFMGAEVVNLFHMPMIPVPPGVGLVVNQHGQRMNAVISYLDGMLAAEDLRALGAELRGRL